MPEKIPPIEPQENEPPQPAEQESKSISREELNGHLTETKDAKTPEEARKILTDRLEQSEKIVAADNQAIEKLENKIKGLPQNDPKQAGLSKKLTRRQKTREENQENIVILQAEIQKREKTVEEVINKIEESEGNAEEARVSIEQQKKELEPKAAEAVKAAAELKTEQPETKEEEANRLRKELNSVRAEQRPAIRAKLRAAVGAPPEKPETPKPETIKIKKTEQVNFEAGTKLEKLKLEARQATRIKNDKLAFDLEVKIKEAELTIDPITKSWVERRLKTLYKETAPESIAEKPKTAREQELQKMMDVFPPEKPYYEKPPKKSKPIEKPAIAATTEQTAIKKGGKEETLPEKIARLRVEKNAAKIEKERKQKEREQETKKKNTSVVLSNEWAEAKTNENRLHDEADNLFRKEAGLQTEIEEMESQLHKESVKPQPEFEQAEFTLDEKPEAPKTGEELHAERMANRKKEVAELRREANPETAPMDIQTQFNTEAISKKAIEVFSDKLKEELGIEVSKENIEEIRLMIEEKGSKGNLELQDYQADLAKYEEDKKELEDMKRNIAIFQNQKTREVEAQRIQEGRKLEAMKKKMVESTVGGFGWKGFFNYKNSEVLQFAADLFNDGRMFGDTKEEHAFRSELKKKLEISGQFTFWPFKINFRKEASPFIREIDKNLIELQKRDDVLFDITHGGLQKVEARFLRTRTMFFKDLQKNPELPQIALGRINERIQQLMDSPEIKTGTDLEALNNAYSLLLRVGSWLWENNLGKDSPLASSKELLEKINNQIEAKIVTLTRETVLEYGQKNASMEEFYNALKTPIDKPTIGSKNRTEVTTLVKESLKELQENLTNQQRIREVNLEAKAGEIGGRQNLSIEERKKELTELEKERVVSNDLLTKQIQRINYAFEKLKG